MFICEGYIQLRLEFSHVVFGLMLGCISSKGWVVPRNTSIKTDIQDLLKQETVFNGKKKRFIVSILWPNEDLTRLMFP